jgi:peptidoglycan-synthase activator LpoB
MISRVMTWALVGLMGMLLVSCSSSPEGRLMGNEEEDYVGSKAAGSATYDRLIEVAVGKLLNRQSAAKKGLDKIKVAFFGVENKSIEDLGDFQFQISELISTAINTSDRYRTISDRFVGEALRETRLRKEQLFIPAHRKTFMKALEATGNPVEFMLFARLTSGTTQGDGVKQRSYMLTMELVDVVTGYDDKESARLRKAYTR